MKAASAAGCLLLFALSAAGQEASVGREPDTLGWHVVRPGETLQSITELYLGTPHLWPDNQRLNPWLGDADRIYPGQRLRVILDRVLPERTAAVSKVARQVEAKPEPNPWIAARQGDLLHEADGLRTYARSSAELTFDDDSRLQVTEDSLIFLRRLDRRLAGPRRQTIELVEGQADLLGPPPAERPQRGTDLEVVVGGAVARPRAVAGKAAEGRARRPAAAPAGASTTAAQVMIFRGASEVEAAGARVEVAAGMGTRVPEGGPPTPPEPLLPAPLLRAPAAGSAWSFSNPRLAWAAVAGATGYVVEVCRDPGCAVLVERSTGLAEAGWRPAALPSGALWWRATAVAPSGLDGFPAAAWPLTIAEGAPPDREPPVVVAAPTGAGRAAGPGEAILGAADGLALFARDDVSGVERVTLRWDEGKWQPWDGAEVAAPPGGRHRLEVRATDVAGWTSTPWSIAVEVDADPPAAPELAPAP